MHTAHTSPAEREARALAGAQKQRTDAEVAATKRAQKRAQAARQQAWAIGAAQAAREQQMPEPPTLATFLESALDG